MAVEITSAAVTKVGLAGTAKKHVSSINGIFQDETELKLESFIIAFEWQRQNTNTSKNKS